MCLWRLTHSEYAHQKVVPTFGNFVQYYKKQGLTPISRIILLLAIIEVVGYEVHRYITTGALPYEEWSEEPLWTDKDEW
jgi:hypothetical protein